MPMPTPNKGESKEAFISRFMSNDRMKGDYSDNKQRVAVAYSQWRRKGKLEVHARKSGPPKV